MSKGFDIDGYLKAKITSLFDKLSKKDDVIKQLTFMKFANDNMAKSREQFEPTELYKKYSELFNSFDPRCYKVTYLTEVIHNLSQLGSVSYDPILLKKVVTEWVKKYEMIVKRTSHATLISKIRRSNEEARIKILESLDESGEESNILTALHLADSRNLSFDATMYWISKAFKNDLGPDFLKNYIGDSEINEGSFLYRLDKLKEYISANFSEEEAELFNI